MLLLDTHAFLWWTTGDERLSHEARARIEAPGAPVFVSAASAWEIATKFRKGKLPGADRTASDIAGAIASQGFASLDVTVAHGQRAGALPGPLNDPFDRMLIAQALIENLALVSNERVFDAYGVRRLW